MGFGKSLGWIDPKKTTSLLDKKLNKKSSIKNNFPFQNELEEYITALEKEKIFDLLTMIITK